TESDLKTSSHGGHLFAEVAVVFKRDNSPTARPAGAPRGILTIHHGTKSSKLRRVPLPAAMVDELRNRVARLNPHKLGPIQPGGSGSAAGSSGSTSISAGTRSLVRGWSAVVASPPFNNCWGT